MTESETWLLTSSCSNKFSKAGGSHPSRAALASSQSFLKAWWKHQSSCKPCWERESLTSSPVSVTMSSNSRLQLCLCIYYSDWQASSLLSSAVPSTTAGGAPRVLCSPVSSLLFPLSHLLSSGSTRLMSLFSAQGSTEHQTHPSGPNASVSLTGPPALAPKWLLSHKNAPCNFGGLGYAPGWPGGDPRGLSNAKLLRLMLVLRGAELPPSGSSGNFCSSFCCRWGVWCVDPGGCLRWMGRTRDALYMVLRSNELSAVPASLNVSLDSHVGWKHLYNYLSLEPHSSYI